ncbi:MAG: tRNA pseudouridine(55) synthase TruB [Polyangiaceae bacterium]
MADRADDACGVLVIDKPRGPTSHDVVSRLRRKLGTRRVGHAGTLDPMATGVLVVAAGEATKLVPYLTASDKAYRAEVRFGVETDTLDAEGQETARAPVAFDRDALVAALDAERRREEQVPPVYSALQIGGRRAHDLARAGVDVELAPRRVSLRSAALCSFDGETADIELLVEKGYYVRALARDLARALGTVGHLVGLRRLRSGAFGLADAIALDASDAETRGALLSLPEAARRTLPPVVLDADAATRARQGKKLTADDLVGSPLGCAAAWFDDAGALVAVGQLDDDGVGRVLRGFTSSCPPCPSRA